MDIVDQGLKLLVIDSWGGLNKANIAEATGFPLDLVQKLENDEKPDLKLSEIDLTPFFSPLSM